jgi:dTDP-glucose 4,6-dehydratase
VGSRRILLAGGSGFIGSHLCDALLERGDAVVVVDSLVTGIRANLVAHGERPDLTLVQADVRDPLTIDGPIDAVMNLASPASPADYLAEPVLTLQTGSRGTERLLELARDHGARFLQASTSEVYGEPLVHPQPESYWGNVNPIGPRSVYDEAKRYAEAITMAYAREYRLEVRLARIFNTYGPRLRPGDGRVVSNFVVQALRNEPITVYGDGHQTRSFCFVTDQVRGLLALLDGPVAGPVNIGNPTETSILALAEQVIDITGSTSEIVHQPLPIDDPTQRCPDITVARTRLGWEPTVGLRDGLERTIEWFRTCRS